jgi:hypothetical protein
LAILDRFVVGIVIGHFVCGDHVSIVDIIHVRLD